MESKAHKDLKDSLELEDSPVQVVNVGRLDPPDSQVLMDNLEWMDNLVNLESVVSLEGLDLLDPLDLLDHLDHKENLDHLVLL